MDDEGTNSKVKIFGNIFISFIGAGILGLPYAFMEAGIFEGIIIMSLVGIVSVKAMLLLIDCKDHIIKNQSPELLLNAGTQKAGVSKNVHVDYGEVGYVALGGLGRVLVDASVILSQIGFTCAYLIFISENLYSIFPKIPKLVYIGFLLVPLILLSNLRHLKALAPFSLFANFVTIFAYSIVFWFDLEHFHLVNLHVRNFSVAGFPFFLGLSIYCYEGAGLVLSLEQSVTKNTRSVFRKVFMFALFLVTLLYILFGIMGYLSFGPETQEIITLNLPAGPFPFIVKFCLCFSLFFTYPIMMFPVSEILEKRLSCTDNSNDNYTKYMMGTILRTALVTITGIIVVFIPTFSTLMALVGSTCCTLLGFILPALFHLKLFRRELTNWELAFDVFLIVLGLTGALLGTHDALARLFTDKTTSLISTLPNVTTPTTTTTKT